MTDLNLLSSACHDGIGSPDYIAYAGQLCSGIGTVASCSSRPAASRTWLRMADTRCGEFGHTACKIGEMLPQLVERKA